MRGPHNVEAVHFLLGDGAPDLHEVTPSGGGSRRDLEIQLRVCIPDLPCSLGTVRIKVFQVAQQVTFDDQLCSFVVFFTNLLPLGLGVPRCQMSQGAQKNQAQNFVKHHFSSSSSDFSYCVVGITKDNEKILGVKVFESKFVNNQLIIYSTFTFCCFFAVASETFTTFI